MKQFLTTLFYCSLCFTAHAEQKMNVLFILADDLGWSDTTLYGTTKLYRTPNLERLAKRGLTFTQAYSASPLCSPSRSAVLTGLSPARTGITTPNCHEPKEVLQATTGTQAPPHQKSIAPVPPTRLKREYRTLAESLKDAGYATGHFGKWHLGPEPFSALQQGFDVDVPHFAGPGPAGSYVAPWKFKDFDADPAEPHQHLEDRMAKEAVTFLEKHREEPFFLNYWMFSVHAPFDAKAALIQKYKALVNPAEAQHSPTYAAMVESMDDAIGTLLDTLDRLKIADRTIIIFTSDNGGNMYSEVDGGTATSNAPLRGGKATLFEGGTRVPCVVAWPGITTPGSRSTEIVQGEDYYPTLLQGLDMKPLPEQTFDGVSILPALKGGKLSRPATFHYFPHDPPVPDWLPPAVSTRSGDWKLIRIFHGGESGHHRHLLFNLAADPSEKLNLAANQPEKVAELDALIEKFLQETHAVVPVANPKFDPAQYRPEDEGQSKPRRKPASKGSAAKDNKDVKDTKDEADPALQGWKARGCQAIAKDGILSIEAKDNTPFLGMGTGKHGGTATVKFRIHCNAGTAHLDYFPEGLTKPAQAVPYTATTNGWQEISTTLPAPGPLKVLRLYLPKQATPVQLDWVEITSAAEPKPLRTDF